MSDSAYREALRKHIAAIDGRRPQDGHSERGFATCPHPDCRAVARGVDRTTDEQIEALKRALYYCIRNHCPNEKLFCGSCTPARDLLAELGSPVPPRPPLDEGL